MIFERKFFAFIILICFFSFAVLYFFLHKTQYHTAVFRIAIVDTSLIKSTAKPFVQVKELIEKEHSQAHQEILEQETSLRAEYEKLKKSKTPARKKQVLKQEFDKKVAKLEQKVHQKKEKIVHHFEEISNMLEKTLKSIVQSIAQENGFNIVLNQYIQETQAVLYKEDTLDITQEVIQKLNQKLPKIEFSKEQPLS